MSNQWSDNLCKRIDAHQEPPPEGQWEDIERILIKEGIIRTQRKKNKAILWARTSATIAAVILALLIFRNANLYEKAFQESKETTTGQAIAPPKNTYSIQKENKQNPSMGNLIHRSTSPNNKNMLASASPVFKKSVKEKEESISITLTDQKEDPYLEAEKKDFQDAPVIEMEADDKHAIAKSLNNEPTNLYAKVSDLQSVKSNTRSNKLETSVDVSNLSTASKKQYDGYGSINSRVMPLDGEYPVLVAESYEDILVENVSREVYTDIKHRQPILIGLSVAYKVDEKWGFKSGLTYTLLSSQLRSGSDSHFYTSEQIFKNVGMQLNINYQVWKNKLISIYWSGGGLVEKNISGKLTTDFTIDNILITRQEEKITLDHLQWSINTALGVQYNLLPRLGLYAETGASHYFKNGSEVETIYNENQINPSLKFGLCFSLNE